MHLPSLCGKIALFSVAALALALYLADDSWVGTMMLVYDEAVHPGEDVSHLRTDFLELRGKQPLQGKTCLVTGTSRGKVKVHSLGLGFGIAVQLLSLGCRTFLGQRSSTGTTEADILAAARKLNPSTSGSLVCFFPIDLSSPRSVRQAVSTFAEPLDVLVLNAIQFPVAKELTEDGIEVALATSYFGHILLVHHLQQHFTNTTRLIMVNSENHKIVKTLQPSSVVNSPNITAGTSLAYYSWLKLLGAAWTQTRMNCGFPPLTLLGKYVLSKDLADPGPVQTDIHRQAPAAAAWIFETLVRPFMKSAIEAAEPFGYLAAGEVTDHLTFESVRHGEYWVMWTKPHRNPLLSNETLLAELWSETSQVLRRLDPNLSLHKAC
jgi:hypothetical protein